MISKSKQVTLNDKTLKTLFDIYKNASKRIVDTVEGASDFRLARNRQILGQISEILDETSSQASQLTKEQVEEYYKRYGDDMSERLRKEGFPTTDSFTTIDQEAVQALANEITQYTDEAFSGVKRSVYSLLNKATSERVTGLIAEGKVTGETRLKISQMIQDELKNGVVSMVDKGGRRWSLESYASMLTRTKLVESANRGMQNRMLKSGYDLVQVSDHAGECKLCSPWENQILSITGKHPDYPSVDDAKDAGLWHPNCRHRTIPYHEKLVETSTVYNPNTGKYIKL